MRSTSTVSVVIPTIGRSSLDTTIESVAQQTTPVDEMIVVADGPLPPASATGIQNALDRHGFRKSALLQPDHPIGACAARNLGLAASSSRFVAFLDDDDSFLPSKMSTQLAILERSSDPRLIVAGQAIYRRTGEKQSVVPGVTYRGDRGVAEYLFARRRLSLSRNLIPTPTWLLSVEHAREVGWNDSLPKHQDWDFLLRSEQLGGRVLQLDSPVAVVWQESVRSITASPMAQSSMDWASSWRDLWSEELFREFLWSQPLRYAVQARDWATARSILEEAGGVWPPSWSALVLAASGALGRHRSLDLVDALDVLRGRRT